MSQGYTDARLALLHGVGIHPVSYVRSARKQRETKLNAAWVPTPHSGALRGAPRHQTRRNSAALSARLGQEPAAGFWTPGNAVREEVSSRNGETGQVA